MLFQPLLLTGWRFDEPSGGNALDHFLAPLVFNVVFVVGTALLVALATRGGGRLATLLTTWSAVTFAGGLAAAACTPLAFAGVPGQAAQAFQTSVPAGLSLGFIVGFVAAVVAALFAGGGSPAANAAEPAAVPELARVRRRPCRWARTGPSTATISLRRPGPPTGAGEDPHSGSSPSPSPSLPRSPTTTPHG